KHCKWLTRIEVVNYDYQGYWQQRGWSDPAPVQMTARINTPLTGTAVTANRTTYIAGVAFSGNKGISEVDVSTDAGQTWQRATLKQPLSSLTWRAMSRTPTKIHRFPMAHQATTALR